MRGSGEGSCGRKETRGFLGIVLVHLLGKRLGDFWGLLLWPSSLVLSVYLFYFCATYGIEKCLFFTELYFIFLCMCDWRVLILVFRLHIFHGFHERARRHPDAADCRAGGPTDYFQC